MKSISDQYGRALRDLRISVTDRCNFRCPYCMPKELFGRDHIFIPHEEILSFEETVRLVKIFKEQGVQKIRLTGGEPLLRKNIERLIAMLAQIDGLDLTLTTNGSLLEQKASLLKQAGLQRLTVSLDALDDQIFKQMNGVNFSVGQVLTGIAAAEAAGFSPIKINMVVKRGLNEANILPMAYHFRGTGHILRFIEYMDVGQSNAWRMDEVVPSKQIIEKIHRVIPIEPLEAHYPGEVATRWRYQDGSGEIGFISSVTQAFCRDCTRLRLTAEGKLYTCLFATKGHDIKMLLRNHSSDEAIATLIETVWRARTDCYSEIRSKKTPPSKKIEMSYIGG